MDKPVLSRMQRSWLQEIGIDARMLAHFSTEPYARAAPAATVATPAPASAQASARPGPAGGPPPVVAKPAADPGNEAPPAKGGSPGATLVAELLKRTPLPRAPGPSSIADTGERPVPGAESPSTTARELRSHAEQCKACGLHEVRGRVVFGEGVETTPQWMFVGEAPGEYDDSVGRPFRGRAGDLLRAMLESIGITDEAPAFFTNVLKCRPMGNRSPQADEVAACLPLLRRQIQLLRPACLIALGRVSAGALLGRDEDLDALRGRVHSYVDEEGRSIPLVVTHHPASLLLHGQLKAEAWRDLNLLVDLRA